MSVFWLKIIAACFMLVDHTGILLYRYQIVTPEIYHWMCLLGRFSFPVYAFLLAEGFRHIRQSGKRTRDHALLLLLLAVVSELVFDRLFQNAWIDSSKQSVILTLLIAFGGLLLAEDRRGKPLVRGAILLASAVLAQLIGSDYGAPGVLLVFGCACWLERFERWGYGRRLLGMLAVMLFYYTVYCWVHSGMGGPAAVWSYARRMGDYVYPHVILIPLLAAYDGKPGPRIKPLHRCYQWFYPAHLAALCLLEKLIS